MAGMTPYHFAPYSLSMFWLLLGMNCVVLAIPSRVACPQTLHSVIVLSCHLRAPEHFRISFEQTGTGKVKPVPTNDISCSNLM